MKRLALIFLVGLSLFSSPSWGANYEKGLFAYDSGDFATALREWTPLAEQGNAYAQNYLGFMNSKGRGVPKNYKKAVQWYKLAADQGYALAQSNLGTMYREGRGVPKDYNVAARLYKLAADQGYGKAQYNLGVMFERGLGVPKDYKEAICKLFNAER